MLISVHGAIGALIGENVNSSIWAFVFAFISHFILDLVPHGDQHQVEYYKSEKKLNKIINLLIVDFLITLIFFIFYFNNARTFGPLKPAILWGIVGGILPDLIVALHNLNRRFFFRLNYFHLRIHQTIKFNIPFPVALIIQMTILFLVWRFYQFQ